METLATATAHILRNARLLAAVGLNAEKIVTQMKDTAALYSDTLAYGEAGRTIRAEAEIIEQVAHEELSDSDREIARMLRTLARNLHMIRYNAETEAVR